MARLRIASVNGQDMVQLVPKTPGTAVSERAQWRGRLLAAMIEEINPDILALVEAPPDTQRTQSYVSTYLSDQFYVYQGEKRGLLGLALLIRKNLGIQVVVRSKSESLRNFKMAEFDADNDGIPEIYSWANRVPLEVQLSDGGLSEPVTVIVVHAKSKGVFIPGDLFAYERLSRASRMKLRAQAHTIRRRIDNLIDQAGLGRVIVLGDMNDGPEFDIYAALLGGAFLEPLMGSVWDPERVLYNPHQTVKRENRWTIDFKDRVVNPLERSRYGQPTDLRSWIDHILLSPAFKRAVVPGSAQILHSQPRPDGLFPRSRRDLPKRGTDHHPPYLDLDL